MEKSKYLKAERKLRKAFEEEVEILVIGHDPATVKAFKAWVQLLPYEHKMFKESMIFDQNKEAKSEKDLARDYRWEYTIDLFAHLMAVRPEGASLN